MMPNNNDYEILTISIGTGIEPIDQENIFYQNVYAKIRSELNSYYQYEGDNLKNYSTGQNTSTSITTQKSFKNKYPWSFIGVEAEENTNCCFLTKTSYCNINNISTAEPEVPKVCDNVITCGNKIKSLESDTKQVQPKKVCSQENVEENKYKEVNQKKSESEQKLCKEKQSNPSPPTCEKVEAPKNICEKEPKVVKRVCEQNNQQKSETTKCASAKQSEDSGKLYRSKLQECKMPNKRNKIESGLGKATSCIKTNDNKNEKTRARRKLCQSTEKNKSKRDVSKNTPCTGESSAKNKGPPETSCSSEQLKQGSVENNKIFGQNIKPKQSETSSSDCPKPKDKQDDRNTKCVKTKKPVCQDNEPKQPDSSSSDCKRKEDTGPKESNYNLCPKPKDKHTQDERSTKCVKRKKPVCQDNKYNKTKQPSIESNPSICQSKQDNRPKEPICNFCPKIRDVDNRSTKEVGKKEDNVCSKQASSLDPVFAKTSTSNLLCSESPEKKQPVEPANMREEKKCANEKKSTSPNLLCSDSPGTGEGGCPSTVGTPKTTTNIPNKCVNEKKKCSADASPLVQQMTVRNSLKTSSSQKTTNVLKQTMRETPTESIKTSSSNIKLYTFKEPASSSTITAGNGFKNKTPKISKIDESNDSEYISRHCNICSSNTNLETPKVKPLSNTVKNRSQPYVYKALRNRQMKNLTCIKDTEKQTEAIKPLSNDEGETESFDVEQINSIGIKEVGRQHNVWSSKVNVENEKNKFPLKTDFQENFKTKNCMSNIWSPKIEGKLNNISKTSKTEDTKIPKSTLESQQIANLPRVTENGIKNDTDTLKYQEDNKLSNIGENPNGTRYSDLFNKSENISRAANTVNDLKKMPVKQVCTQSIVPQKESMIQEEENAEIHNRSSKCDTNLSGLSKTEESIKSLLSSKIQSSNIAEKNKETDILKVLREVSTRDKNLSQSQKPISLNLSKPRVFNLDDGSELFICKIEKLIKSGSEKHSRTLKCKLVKDEIGRDVFLCEELKNGVAQAKAEHIKKTHVSSVIKSKSSSDVRSRCLSSKSIDISDSPSNTYLEFKPVRITREILQRDNEQMAKLLERYKSFEAQDEKTKQRIYRIYSVTRKLLNHYYLLDGQDNSKFYFDYKDIVLKQYLKQHNDNKDTLKHYS